METADFAIFMLQMFVCRVLPTGPGGAAGWGGSCKTKTAAGQSDRWVEDQENGGGHFAAGGPKLQVSQGEVILAENEGSNKTQKVEEAL